MGSGPLQTFLTKINHTVQLVGLGAEISLSSGTHRSIRLSQCWVRDFSLESGAQSNWPTLNSESINLSNSLTQNQTSFRRTTGTAKLRVQRSTNSSILLRAIGSGASSASMASQKWSKDVVAVVTGGNKGIGFEIVKGLARAGISVVLTARDEGRGKAAVEALQKERLNTVHFHQLAVDDVQSVKSLGSWLEHQFGGIDILVNNAGVHIQEVSIENAQKTFETNFWGVRKVTEGLLPLLTLKPSGLRRIVVVSSQIGQLRILSSEKLRAQLNDVDNMSFDDVEAFAQKYLQDVRAGTMDEWSQDHRGIKMYPESKAILNAYLRILAKSLASKEIYVNVTCPGYTSTDLSGGALSRGKPAAEGADTMVWLALLPEENYPTGKFFVNRKETEF